MLRRGIHQAHEIIRAPGICEVSIGTTDVLSRPGVCQGCGMLSSGGGNLRTGHTATLDMRRHPFPAHVYGRVVVPFVDCIAALAGPQPITQGNGRVDEATDMTPFGRGEKAVDMVHMRPVLRCGLVHNLLKAPKAQSCDFAPPQRLHAAQVQVFQIDRVIGGTQFVGNPGVCQGRRAADGQYAHAPVPRHAEPAGDGQSYELSVPEHDWPGVPL
jgi:hypothetical protein